MPFAHVALMVLDRNPEVHGYALKAFSELAAWVFPMTNPPIYPTLRRLEEQGWATSRTEEVGGRTRRLYAITEEGRAELRRWLADPEALPVEKGAWRDPMFRIGMLDCGGLEGARLWLRRGIEYWERYIEDYQQFQPTIAKEDKYMALGMEIGIKLARTHIENYRRVLAEVERDLGGAD